MTIAYKDQILEQVPAAATTIYTAPTIDSAHILAATVFNESASNVVLTGNIVQSGGSVAVTNQYVNVIIPASKPVVLVSIINAVLKTGDLISFTSDTASALNIKLAIKEITT